MGTDELGKALQKLNDTGIMQIKPKSFCKQFNMDLSIANISLKVIGMNTVLKHFGIMDVGFPKFLDTYHC